MPTARAFWSISDLAARWQVSTRTVRRLIQGGQLRAIRIGNKLHFQLDAGAVEPIKRLTPLLREIPPARLSDEVLKLLMCRDAVEKYWRVSLG